MTPGKGKVKAPSEKVINRKRRKVKPSQPSGSDVPLFSNSSNVLEPVPEPPLNPWALDDRSNAAPFTPVKKGKLADDVLTCITPRKRPQSLEHLPLAPSRRGSSTSEHSPPSPINFTVSPDSPTIMGLCHRTVENWVVGKRDDSDFEVMDEVDRSPVSPTATSRYGSKNDQQILLGSMEDDPVQTTLHSVRGPPVFNGFSTSTNVDSDETTLRGPHGRHAFSNFVFPPANVASDSDLGPQRMRSNTVPMAPKEGHIPAQHDSPLAPHVSLARGFRGASDGSATGLSGNDWRNKFQTVKRSNSNGFNDVFAIAAPPVLGARRITRKKGGFLKEMINNNASNQERGSSVGESGAGEDEDEMMSSE
jgi:hypothetical protein